MNTRSIGLDDPVVDPGAVAARSHDVLRAEDRQLLADDGLRRPELVLQVGDVPLAVLQRFQDPEPERMTEDADDAGRPLEHP